MNRQRCAILLLTTMLAMPVQGDVAKLRDFVEQVYPHGVPMEQAQQFNAVDSLVLHEWLQNRPAMAPYHGTMLQLMGFIGADHSGQQIAAYIEAGQGTIDEQAFDAKLDGLMALGYLLHQTDDPIALQYLIDSLDVPTWQQRDLQWQVASLADESSLLVQLSQQAAIALALSGHPLAAEALRAKHAPADTLGAVVLPASDGFLENLLQHHQSIAEDGLEAYLQER